MNWLVGADGGRDGRRGKAGPFLAVTVVIITAVAVVTIGSAHATTTPAVQATPTAPGIPGTVQTIGANAAIEVSWTTPYSGGAATITKYVATASPGGATCTSIAPAADTCTIGGPSTGLVNGSTYSVTVRATNSAGFNSAPSTAVVATPSNAQNCSYVGPYANLQGCTLTSHTLNGNLTGANLAGTNLAGFYLNDVTLTNANLSGTVLTNATVVNVSSGGITATTPPSLPSSQWSLTPAPSGYLLGPQANLSGAQLTGVAPAAGVSLSGANLSGANLTNANLASTNLTNATLTGATLTGALFPQSPANLARVISGSITPSSSTTSPSLPTGWGLLGGYLIGSGANLDGANLAGLNLGGLALSSTNLSYANLTGTNLTGTNLTNATLRQANLTNANLANAVLQGVSSGSITTQPTGLPAGWSLIDDYLVGPGADLNGANLSNAIFSDINLSGANLTDATLTGASFTNSNLTNTTLTGVVSGSVTADAATLATLPPIAGTSYYWQLVDGYLIGFGANLAGAQLAGANLAGDDLGTADLQGANLSSAILGTSSAGDNLGAANLTAVDLAGATLSHVNLTGSLLNGGTLGPLSGLSPNTFPFGWADVNNYLVGPLAPAITSITTTTFTVGVAGSFTVATTGRPAPALTEAGPLPGGVTFVDNTTTASNGAVALTGSASLSGTPVTGSAGTYPLTISATNNAGVTAVQSFTLIVSSATPSSDFSLSATPGSESVVSGSIATESISTTVTSGSPESVVLSFAGLPSGALASFAPSPTVTAGQTSIMSIQTVAGTLAGQYSVTVTGTAASGIHTTTFTLTVTTPSTATPRLVQIASANEAAAATSLQATFSTPTTSGDLLVLSASEYTGATNHIKSVTDSAGNVWSLIGAYDFAGHNSEGEMWYSSNASPATTVTVHTASASFVAFEVEEFSSGTTNPLVIDSSAGTSPSTTGTAANSGTADASATGELAVGFVAGHGNAEAISVPSVPFTVQAQVTTTGSIATLVTGDEVTSGSGSQSFAASFKTAMYWAAGIATFKASSTSAPAVRPAIARHANLAAVPASSASPVGTTPSASGFVDSANPSINFGGASALDISSSEYQTYLKFDTTEIPQGATIDSATLTVTPDTAPTGSSAGAILVYLPASTPDAWSQETLSDNTAPPLSATAVATGSSPAVAGVSQQFNVVSAITEGGNTNFGIGFSSASVATLYGAATGSNAPVLSVTYTTQLTASAGTFISTANPGTGYDGVNPLSFSLSSYQAFLSFPTAALGSGVSVQSASLTVTPTTVSAAGVVTVFATPPFTASAVDASPAPTKGALAGTGTVPLTCTPTCVNNTITLNSATTGLFSPGRDTNVELGVLTGGTLDKISNQAQATAPSLQLTVELVPPPTVPAQAANNLCGSSANQTIPTSKVMIIWEENKSWLDQGQSGAPALDGDTQDAPYINSLANQCAVVSNNSLSGEAGYQSDSHGSLGNYLAVATGDLSSYEGTPWSTDCPADQADQPPTPAIPVPGSCSASQSSIFNQGASWKGYAESMDSACENQDGGGTFSSGPAGSVPVNYYLNRHNPPVYFSNLANCLTNDVPFSADDAEAGNPLYNDVMSGNLPTISSVTPNSLDDGHYSPGISDNGADDNLENQDTDAWLQTWLPIITSGPDYQSGDLTILVAWDEGYGANPSPTGTVYTPSNPPLLVISPYVTPGTTDSNGTTYSAASITRTVEEIAGEPLLNSAVSAPDLKSWLSG